MNKYLIVDYAGKTYLKTTPLVSEDLDALKAGLIVSIFNLITMQAVNIYGDEFEIEGWEDCTD